MCCPTLVPTPNVSVTAFGDQTFNSLLLECNITTVRGISLDIVWMANDTIIQRVNGSLGNLVNNVVIHKDVYHISNVGGDSTEYLCHALINESSVATGKIHIFIV